MNKLFIGLLIVAAGAGVFFLLSKKKDEPVADKINKEWIIGKWQTISVEPLKDSAEKDYRFEFQPEGLVLRSKSDSLEADSTHYAWTEKDELLIRENPSDTVGARFTVLKLSTDTLSVKGEEQTWIFHKVK